VVKFLKRHGIEPKVLHKVGAPGEQIAKAGHRGKFDLRHDGLARPQRAGQPGDGLRGHAGAGALRVPVLLVR
jgi:hypothetical protein